MFILALLALKKFINHHICVQINNYSHIKAIENAIILIKKKTKQTNKTQNNDWLESKKRQQTQTRTQLRRVKGM